MKPPVAARRTPLLDCQASGSWQDRIGIEESDGQGESDRETVPPVTIAEYDPADLLAAITPENIQAEVDFGTPVGRERL
ncbi:hypothetical protein ACLRDC_19285 [Gluconacetobacter sacchari]|uniref:AbrB/MazE/SpoVT family DNA-binding domain-containing protein n=1 Tax=Gluconacetobacter sacchari TaxID=92759 RepID=UPI0039B62913